MAHNSPAALIGPVLERIHQNASGRKYSKLRQDAKALLEKLDALTALQTGARPPSPGPKQQAAVELVAEAAVLRDVATPAEQPAQEQPQAVAQPAEPAADSTESSEALDVAVAGSRESSRGSEQAQVQLEAGEDGDVHLKLGVQPRKAAEPASAGVEGAADDSQDPGHLERQGEEGGAAPDAAAAVTPSLPPRPPRRPRAEEMPSRPGTLTNQSARELLAFLRDAISTRKPQVMELSLDLIQKLISFKLLQGPVYSINHRRDTTAKPGKKGEEEEMGAAVEYEQLPPQAQALELICWCDDVSDEAVELRLLKALLTAVTSSTVSVHGQALLLVVRACYNVFLTSRSDVNQATAKATLTQMLNVVFQRMEAGSINVVVPPIMVQDVLGLPSAEASTMSAFVQSFLHDVVTSVDPFGYVAEGIQQGLDDAFQQPSKEHELEEDYYDPSDPSDRQQIEWRQGGAGPEASPARAAPEGGGGAASVNGEPTPAGLASPESAVSGPSAVLSPGEGGDLTSGMSETTSNFGGGSGAAEPGLSVASQLQKDAFLVFRALCKLSIRSADAAPGSELTTIRGKVLALQLLKILLENSGPVFHSTERFITAIKQYLCLSLLKNCASQYPQAQRLCCSIFLTLMSTFRKNLKAEIGVFFPMIMLRPIEPAVGGSMPNAAGAAGAVAVDIAHKTVVLQCVQKMCENGQLLVDLFVNYDCDLEGANLFERMITALVRIAQGSLAHDTTIQNPMEEQVLRFEALRCLVLALRSMTLWYNTTVDSAASAALAQEAATAAAAEELQQQGLPAAAELGVADETIKSTWMETLAAGSVDDRPPVVSPPGVTPSSSEAGLAGMDSEQRQAQMLESWKAFKRVFQEGVALFNKKPKKGIAYLQEQKLIGAAPSDVAHFLEKTQGLNKTMIGDYLGERDDFNLKVMHAYVDAMDFSAMEFDEAIRKFLSGFRLPGEAQKIDRLMEKFAERFVLCNPDSFKSADVGYVLAYSVIMLNTDAHNPMVKNKMSKQDFLRNNRGINDGGDLPAEFMEALYDRIINNEIKMKDDPIAAVDAGNNVQAAASAGWLETIMNVLGRAKPTSNEPTEESIRRTHDYLREKAKGVTFFETMDGEAIRPMLDVAWAPMLGAFSVLFEEKDDEHFTGLCLNGIAQAVRLTCLLNMVMLRNTFVSSLARFTMLHSPAAMKLKSAWAFRALLKVADQNGNSLQDCWSEVLRCVSRFELLQQATAGVPTDALLFAMPVEKESATSRLKHKLQRQKGEPEAKDSFSSINDMGLHSIPRGHGKDSGLPAPEIMLSVDPQEINRLFMNSAKLDSEAIVQFVRTLSSIAQEELKPVHSPRVFSLTKIVEISHFNMGRIRLVWNRIWAVLSDFFIDVGCHRNLQVAMYGVDSLRQLAMKFLERDELANYTFQNDFLRPFVVIMRHSRAVEIRELIIRCVSQMVLARVANVKSGWKTMFMVFTTAANDESPQIVRLAFDTIEKIVREYFHFITEVETTTFTDCVNCLIAYTNNPHSLDVSLNAIAFLRFCAMKLAEGDIGDVEELPEGTEALMNPNAYRIRPRGQDLPSPSRNTSRDEAAAGTPASASNGTASSPHPSGTRIKFTDKDEHMYFWFPLLAGLSELTFDPRSEIRYSALEVLFDILKFHGASFTPQFWTRVFDSVLLPIFDHVRAEVTDTTTFTDEKRRSEVDAWLYETCTRTLQHIVEIVVQYYSSVSSLLERILDLLLGFIQRTHQALAAVGVAAMTRLILAAGTQMDNETWMVVMNALSTAAGDTLPNVPDLIQHRMARRTITSEASGPAAAAAAEPVVDFGVQSPSMLRSSTSATPSELSACSSSLDERRPAWSLGEGAGARRLAEVKIRAAIQLLIVQSCGEVYSTHARHMPAPAAVVLLDVLRSIATHAATVDADIGLRHSLLLAEAADKVPADRCLPDPPLLRLEAEASQAYLSTLLHISAAAPEATRDACTVEARLVQLCMRNLERFEGQEMAAESGEGAGPNGIAASHQEENAALAPLVVATLRAMLAFSPQVFKTHLKDFFPLLTNLISCEYAPLEVQKALSELFAQRIGGMLG